MRAAAGLVLAIRRCRRRGRRRRGWLAGSGGEATDVADLRAAVAVGDKPRLPGLDHRTRAIAERLQEYPALQDIDLGDALLPYIDDDIRAANADRRGGSLQDDTLVILAVGSEPEQAGTQIDETVAGLGLRIENIIVQDDGAALFEPQLRTVDERHLHGRLRLGLDLLVLHQAVILLNRFDIGARRRVGRGVDHVLHIGNRRRLRGCRQRDQSRHINECSQATLRFHRTALPQQSI
jgi:hypothetical protein